MYKTRLSSCFVTQYTLYCLVISDRGQNDLTLLPSSALFTCVSMIKEPFPLKIANCVSDIFYPNNLSGITNLQAEWHFGVNSLIMGISAIINKRGGKVSPILMPCLEYIS